MKDIMHNQEKNFPSERIELNGILSEFRDALEDEINKIKKSGQSSTLLHAGKQTESHSAEFWYQFAVEYIPTLPADTPCKLLIDKEQYDVTVISLEENSIIVSAKTKLPENIGKARLENGATVLMERLIECIEENAQIENSVGLRMLRSEDGVYSARRIFTYDDLILKVSNTPNQNNAIISALSNDITYIWGPPGTGKTTVIGQIIDELYKHDRSVLVVSHTNTAVNEAIKKADEFYSAHSTDDTSYPILRIGASTGSLPNKVLLESHVAELGTELYEKKAFLEKQKGELWNRLNEILPLFAKSIWINECRLNEIGIMIKSCATYEDSIKEIRCEIDEINEAMQQEKKAHPEYAKFLNLSKTVKSKRSDYETLCEQVNKVKLEINDLPAQIQQALDEFKKHDVYAELRKQESKFMSVAFLQNELIKISSRIQVLNTEIALLTENQAIAQEVITDYEKKNSITKLFSGKGSVTQAQTTLQTISARLPQVKEELLQQHNLASEYNRQLESILLLQEQIKAVIPTETKEYWESTLEQLQSAYEAAKDTLLDLEMQKSSLYDDLCNLEEQQSRAKTSFDVLSEYGRRKYQKQRDLEKINFNYAKESSRCAEYLEKESSYCADFYYTPIEVEKTLLFAELTRLLDFVKSEVASVDMDVLKDEKKVLDNKIKEVACQLDEIKEKIQGLEKQAIMSAKIVGATLAKSYLSKTLREIKFDTVILDEASMASIPALWCASYLAESSIVIIGDFLQLPPIVMAETTKAQKWLGKDIFYHSGMQEMAKDKENCPDNFVMLNDQFRMESDIAEIVSSLYYSPYGGLCSHDHSESRVEKREKFYAWYPGKKTRQNVHLIDTESLHAWVTGVPQGKSHSRLNCFSAAVVVDLAFKFLENKLNSLNPETAKPVKDASVLIVAPYKPHITRINQLIELEYRNRGFQNLNLIKAGTIHSFQGSEADIVIFDLVIDEPHWRANLFMTDEEVNEDLRKMFNVAITRARFKLYIVGNFAYCQKRAKDNALSELLDKLIKEKRLEKIDAKQLLPNIIFSRPIEFSFDGNLDAKHIVCQESSFRDYFMKDINSFKKRLIIYSPFMTEARLSDLLPAFVDALNLGKQIIVVTKPLSDRGKAELMQYQKCEKKLRDDGVTILHKKGMHEKVIFIDSDAVWSGSLNALSFTGLTGEIMHRHADREITEHYEALLGIEHLCETVENIQEQKCPICGGEMLIRESDEGGIYWQCVNRDYSRNATQQYPFDGILRCKCGAPYVFAMKNEPRWVCTEDSKHYQKMRESDLKLEKMAALIPTKAARMEVDRYFELKRRERESGDKVKTKGKISSAKSVDDNVTDTNSTEQLELF